MSNQIHDASVVLVLDTNSTLCGQKIEQVSNSIREIIANARATVKFNVFVTSPTARELISDVKQKLNVNTLVQQISSSCTSTVNNFDDTWGLALNEIPYDEKCYSHIILLSTGMDTGSIIYNLDSVINLLNQKFSRNPDLKISFIQAGPSAVITSALQTKCNFSARSQLLQTSPYAWIEAQLNSLSLGGNSIGGGVKTHFYTPNVTNNDPNGLLYTHPVKIGIDPSGWSPQPTPTAHATCQKSLNYPVTTTTTPTRKRVPKPAKIPVTSSTSMQNTFKVWVGNIPMVSHPEILDYLRQWCPCKIETINGSPNQWAVVAYQNQNSVEYAVKYGNGSVFKGQVINVNKI